MAESSISNSDKSIGGNSLDSCLLMGDPKTKYLIDPIPAGESPRPGPERAYGGERSPALNQRCSMRCLVILVAPCCGSHLTVVALLKGTEVVAQNVPERLELLL